MNGKLLTYRHVLPGFEMVVEKSQVMSWNLWWNTNLKDDPEAWDEEIKSINKMQSKLGELTEDRRLIRAQMAEFCRYSPMFPRSVDLLCKSIGEDRFPGRVKMGCEGRGLFESIFRESVDDQSKEILKEYSKSLQNWLAKDRALTVRDSKVFSFLGDTTDKKRDVVSKLISIIDGGPTTHSLMELSENICKEMSENFESFKHRPFNCFSCQAQNSAPECLCCHAMFIDASLLCIGISNDKPPSVKFKRFVEENVLAYCLAINSWLTGEPPKLITTLTTTNFLSEADATRISKNVHSSLGTKDDAKEWLAACLLKTLKDNQRWHKDKELIDDFPDSVSWFKES